MLFVHNEAEQHVSYLLNCFTKHNDLCFNNNKTFIVLFYFLLLNVFIQDQELVGNLLVRSDAKEFLTQLSNIYHVLLLCPKK